MLTPLDIENRRFKKEIFGYNQIEVEDFLVEVSSTYEKLYKDNNAALARINMLTDAIKQYKTMEETLQNAMSVAQTSGEEIRVEAREAADRLIVNAEEQAQNIVADARRKAAEITYKSEQIKRTAEVFKKQTIELLMEQLEFVKKRHSAAMPEFDSSESFGASAGEEIEDFKMSATETPLPSNAINLSKILQDVGKISESIDGFVPADDNDDNGLSQAETTAEPKGVAELFDDDE